MSSFQQVRQALAATADQQQREVPIVTASKPMGKTEITEDRCAYTMLHFSNTLLASAVVSRPGIVVSLIERCCIGVRKHVAFKRAAPWSSVSLLSLLGGPRAFTQQVRLAPSEPHSTRSISHPAQSIG